MLEHRFFNKLLGQTHGYADEEEAARDEWLNHRIEVDSMSRQGGRIPE
jgi:hypothetical protein